MTVYLCLFACILLFFGGLGTFVAQSLVAQLAWGTLILAGIITFVLAWHFRPGVDVRTAPRK
jgi:hypothetical protein